MTENSDKFVPWKEVGNWECQKCSVCCYHYTVPLTEEEVEFFKKSGHDIVRQDGDQWYMYHEEGKPCVFLDKSDEFKEFRMKEWTA